MNCDFKNLSTRKRYSFLIYIFLTYLCLLLGSLSLNVIKIIIKNFKSTVMIKFLQKCIVFTFILMQSLQSNAQNIFNGEPVQWVGRPNGYSTNPYNSDYRTTVYRKLSTTSSNPNDGRGQWSTTINVQNSGGNITPDNMSGGGGAGWLLISGPSSGRFNNKWNFNGVGQAAINSINGLVKQSGGQDMGLNMSALGYYTFNMKDAGYINSEVFIGFTNNNPVSIIKSSQSYSGQQPIINITTGTTPSSGENIYVRYNSSNDFTSSSSVVQATGSGTLWTATLPSQSCGSTLFYYVYTSTRTLAQINSDSESNKSLAALRYDDNFGNNFSTTLPIAITYYRDLDNDGFGNSGITQLSCSEIPLGYVANNIDTNDNLLTYVDNDSDGFGSTVFAPNGPINNADCNDNQLQYVDNDADGFGQNSYSACSGILNNIDSNDNLLTYVDNDSDGFGSNVFALNGPINNTDCNDNNALIYQSATLFIDVDADNYNNGTQVVCYGATVPAGYSLTTLGLDCNDANASVFVNGTYYLDTDNDGFGAGSSVTLCVANAAVAPNGYSLNNTDCDNTKATVYPGAPELCYDGLDNNCNGTIDEGCTPIVSTVQSTQCGVTLPLIDSDVFANNVSGAQGYRFRVTNMTTGLVQSIDKFLRVFKITQLPVYAFNTIYQVEVSVRINNVWQPFFGSPCMVSTPATTTQLQATQCGGTLTAMSDVIYANAVPFSTGYRFRVTNVLTSTQQILDRTIREFRMTLITNPEFNTNYTVEVAIRNTNGVYLPYGNVCTITTPSFPTTQLQLTQCDYTALSSSEVLFADSYPGVTTYRFRLSNATLGYAFTVDRPTRTVTLSLFPGLVASTTYSAQVSVKINGVFGPFGKICGLTTPVTITTRDVVDGTNELSEVKGFKVVAYPNPFAENFKLNLSSSSDEKVQIRVYDMLGKLIEDKQVAATEIASVEVGVNYPSGVYNVVVSQASDTQTLRVIKR